MEEAKKTYYDVYSMTQCEGVGGDLVSEDCKGESPRFQ